MSFATLDLVARAIAVPVSAGILVNGIEEMAIDLQYFARGLHRRQRRTIGWDELADAPPRRIAIMVPAWDEAEVIESMLEHNHRTLDYDPARYDIFCGTYQNDLETQRKVSSVARRHPNVHKVVVPHDGPTSKADCLNWIYQGIVLEERRRGQRFDILLMHDAEDVIHPLALRLYATLIPKYEFVQTPVFSLKLRRRDLVASTYIDEFAEFHLKDMLVREAMGGLVPSAGVGSAFERNAFEEIALAHHQNPFHVGSLTEDYEVGLKFRLAGKRVHFACRSLQRTVEVPRRLLGGTRRVVQEEYIATREYFPAGFRASVRQRARWVTGIALQTWRQIGWQGPAAVRYCLWRDRKALLTNLLLLLAYGLFAYMLGSSALSLAGVEGAAGSSIAEPYSLIWVLLATNLFFLVWRAAMKMSFVGRLYGAGHALMSVPRLILGNLIGLAATGRAVRQYVHHLWTGTPLRWHKTAHHYPSVEVLAAQHRRLGEFLVDRAQLSREEVEEALRLQAGTGLPLGEVIAASGMMPSRAVLQALGDQLEMPVAEPRPDAIALELLRKLPEEEAAALEALPISTTPNGRAVIAMRGVPTPEDLERLSARMGGPVLVALAQREPLRRARWRAYRRLGGEARPAGPRLGEALVALGRLDQSSLNVALEEQLETGERLGELLVRWGMVAPADVTAALSAPRLLYLSVAPAEVSIAALRAIGYGTAFFYQLAPVMVDDVTVLACPSPVHPQVLEEVSRRLGGAPVARALAPGLEVRIALALASRRAWPQGGALQTPGIEGEELAALLCDKSLSLAVDEIRGAGADDGQSPIDYLESVGRIGRGAAARLRAIALGLDIELADPPPPAGGELPPELVARHEIRVIESDARGLVLAAPRPTPLLANQVAELFIERAVAWRVLAGEDPRAVQEDRRVVAGRQS